MIDREIILAHHMGLIVIVVLLLCHIQGVHRHLRVHPAVFNHIDGEVDRFPESIRGGYVLPAMSKAVPWAGDVRTTGSPAV